MRSGGGGRLRAGGQRQGEPLDGGSDLWSFGVVLHEMLTGRPPFGGGYDLSTLYSILHEQPQPPSASSPDVPEALDALVDRLLSKEPSARLASAERALAELEAAAVMPSGTTPGRRGGRWNRRRALLAAVAVVVAGGAFASIAVLPFVDPSPDGEQEYFADGITEELLTALAQVPGLRVPARTSSFYFKGRSLPVGEVGRQLGVATVLEGSVFEEATRIDPAYARAHAGLALAHAVLIVSGGEAAPEETVRAVDAAADRALALDASLAEAHAARGYAYH